MGSAGTSEFGLSNWRFDLPHSYSYHPSPILAIQRKACFSEGTPPGPPVSLLEFVLWSCLTLAMFTPQCTWYLPVLLTVISGLEKANNMNTIFDFP